MHFSFHYGCIYLGRTHSETTTYRFSCGNAKIEASGRGSCKRCLTKGLSSGALLMRLTKGSNAQHWDGRLLCVVPPPKAQGDQSVGYSFRGCCEQQCGTSEDHGAQ